MTDLAAIRERDAEAGPLPESPPLDWEVWGIIAQKDRRALLAHIDALAAKVEGMRTYPFKEAPYGDQVYAMVLQSAVLAIIRGDAPIPALPPSDPTLPNK